MRFGRPGRKLLIYEQKVNTDTVHICFYEDIGQAYTVCRAYGTDKRQICDIPMELPSQVCVLTFLRRKGSHYENSAHTCFVVPPTDYGGSGGSEPRGSSTSANLSLPLL
jgi:hypothetical protein